MRFLRIVWFTLAGWLPIVLGLPYFVLRLLALRAAGLRGPRLVENAQAFNHAFWRWYFRRLPFVCVTVTGADRLPAGGAYLLVTNHASFLDVPLLFSIVPRVSGIARDYLFRVPFLGSVLRALGFVPIERLGGGDGTSSLVACRDALQQGRPILIMPEGERSGDGRLGRFRLGAFHLSALSGAPIVPAALTGLEDALPRGRLLPRTDRRVRVGVAFLDPIAPPASTERTVLQDAAERTRELLAAALVGTTEPGPTSV